MPILTEADIFRQGLSGTISASIAASSRAGITDLGEMAARAAKAIQRNPSVSGTVDLSAVSNAITTVQSARNEANNFFPFGSYASSNTPVVPDPRLKGGKLQYRVLVSAQVPTGAPGQFDTIETVISVISDISLTPRDLRSRAQQVARNTNRDINYVAELHLPAVQGRPATVTVTRVLEIYRGEN